ncbi:hypothetical protein [Thioalkalivibrio sp. ALMg13-2]|uniref:DinB/UmuC family translesion DNA polymerase n=1 Tax=Thioalkalivibrio sp. ALMg13-2 TaxID=1158167 RepID=UPI001E58BF92|nr:hypothetical protein [Thioalkalivibrio sp. ALMg13-2]
MISNESQPGPRIVPDLRTKGYLGRTVGIKIRYDDFRTATRDLTLEAWTADPEQILAATRDCLRRTPLDRPMRLLGVRIGKRALDARQGAMEQWQQAVLPF